MTGTDPARRPSGLEDDVRQVLAPIVALVRLSIGPVTSMRLDQAVADVLGICREHDEQGDVVADMLIEATNELEDR